MDTSEPATPSTSYANATIKQFVNWLDIRGFFNFYEAPEFIYIQKAVKEIFPNDPKLIVQKMTGPMTGVFKIISLGQPVSNSVHLNRPDRTTGVAEVVTVPLSTSSPGKRSREDDLLITIVDGDVGRASSIAGRDFDETFKAFGEVVVPTKPQVYKDTSIYNGNRLIVIDRKNYANKKIPDRLELKGQKFLLKYKGKEWMCSSCNELHKGPCPYLAEFYAQRAAKCELEVKTLVVGDSALRHVENVGLKADVACMSGACAGQLVSALEQHPRTQNFTKVVIAAGANDTKVRTNVETDEIIRLIDKSLSRVTKVVEERDNIEFTILNTIPPAEEPLSQAEFVAKTYFKKRIESLSIKYDNLKAINIKSYPEKWDRGHPTVKCTEKIIRVLGAQDEELILNTKFTTTTKMYRGVDNLWLSGCTGCGSRGLFVSGGFCTKCIGDIERQEIADPNILDEVYHLYKAEFPQGQKRLRGDLTSTSSDDDGHKVAKF